MIYQTSLSLLSKEERGYFIRRRLEAYREGTQALAQIFGVNKSTMWKWLTGHSVPAGKNLEKFEELLAGYQTEKPFEFYTTDEKKRYEKTHEKIEYEFIPLAEIVECGIYNYNIYGDISILDCNKDV